MGNFVFSSVNSTNFANCWKYFAKFSKSQKLKKEKRKRERERKKTLEASAITWRWDFPQENVFFVFFVFFFWRTFLFRTRLCGKLRSLAEEIRKYCVCEVRERERSFPDLASRLISLSLSLSLSRSRLPDLLQSQNYYFWAEKGRRSRKKPVKTAMDSNGKNHATELLLAVATGEAPTNPQDDGETGGAWRDPQDDGEWELESPTLKLLAQRLRLYRYY